MKMTSLPIWVVAAILSIHVQSNASDCTFGDCGPDYTTDCGSSTNWADMIDLNGDGTSDFLHLQVVRYQYCALKLDPDNFRRMQRDTVEAMYPQGGVEMYALEGYHPTPFHVPSGQLIEPKGSGPFLGEGGVSNAWLWTPNWVPRILPHSGLGICEHSWGSSPCDEYPQLPSCEYATQTGWLRAKNPGIFGFRIARPDGWHLGWFKLAELATPIIRPDGKRSSVKLLDYAVHPDPGTAIRAGEKARPVLKAQITGGGTLLSWSTNWPGWRLSWSPTLNPMAWAPVAGVATNTNRVTLASTNASGFFRLQETP